MPPAVGPSKINLSDQTSAAGFPCNCNEELITAICAPILMLNLVFIFRYGLEVDFFSKKVFSVLEVSDAAAITIGLLGIVNFARIKNNNELTETTKDEAPKIVQERDPEKTKNLTARKTTAKITEKPSVSKLNKAKVEASPGLSRYATISNGDKVSANSYDRAGSGVNMNCFFHSILTNMRFENDLAESQNHPPVWNPQEFFPPNSTCTFKTASYNDYQFAANKLRTEFGNADLAEWNEGGFATTINAGIQTPGFYAKWALIKRAIYAFEHHLPRPTPLPPRDLANNPNYQRNCQEIQDEQREFREKRKFMDSKFLEKFHLYIKNLKKIFPDLKKWDDAAKAYVDGPSIWLDYESNYDKWYWEVTKNNITECGIHNDERFVTAHMQFIRDLCVSLKPLSDGYVVPEALRNHRQHARDPNISNGTVPPLLFDQHFSPLGLNLERQKQKIEWFTCLTQTLIENIEAHCIQAPEVQNQAYQVPSGFIHQKTINTFLEKHCVAGTEMSLLGCSRAHLRFNREIVYFKPGQAPGHVTTTHVQLPCFYIYNSGGHWTGVEQDKGSKLALGCKQLLDEAETLPRASAKKNKTKQAAEIR